MGEKKIIERWKTKDGILRLSEVIKCLKKGKSLSSISGLEKHLGRWDLRGAKLSILNQEISIKAEGHSFVQKFGTLKLKQVKLDSIDFSLCDLSYSHLEKCEIKNCIFEKTNAIELYVIACDILDTSFIKTNLYYSYLNKNVGKNSGKFQNVNFINCNLKKCLFYFPIMENCVFENCNLYKTDFDGSRINNCRFIGELDSCWFRGYSTIASKSYFRLFYRINPKNYPNPMKNVDFSEANFYGVSFSDEIDLNNCLFPSDESSYIIVKNLATVYAKVLKIIDEKWTGEDKRIGQSFINNIFFQKNHRNQPVDLIDKRILTDDGKDISFGEKLFNLIKDINHEVNRNSK